VLIYPDDRVLIAIVNNFYFSKTFDENKYAIHFYAQILGHELLTRRDLIPTEPDHKRAGDWYYKLELGPLQHKLPPIISERWRRISFIVTTGDRFEAAEEIKDLYAQYSPTNQPFVVIKEQQNEFPNEEEDQAD
jgi:hypothetical protein